MLTAAIRGQTLQIKLAISYTLSVLTAGQPVWAGTRQGSHQSTYFGVTGIARAGKAGINKTSEDILIPALEVDILNISFEVKILKTEKMLTARFRGGRFYLFIPLTVSHLEVDASLV